MCWAGIVRRCRQVQGAVPVAAGQLTGLAGVHVIAQSVSEAAILVFLAQGLVWLETLVAR